MQILKGLLAGDIKQEKKMVENYILYGIVLLLAILNVVDRARFAKKESELLNRLMAKTWTDYVYGIKTLAKQEKKTVNDLMEDKEKTLPIY